MHSLTLAIIDFNRLAFQRQMIEQNLVSASEETKQRLAASYDRALEYLDRQVKYVDHIRSA